jgi:hypothetical protein
MFLRNLKFLHFKSYCLLSGLRSAGGTGSLSSRYFRKAQCSSAHISPTSRRIRSCSAKPARSLSSLSSSTKRTGSLNHNMSRPGGPKIAGASAKHEGHNPYTPSGRVLSQRGHFNTIGHQLLQCIVAVFYATLDRPGGRRTPKTLFSTLPLRILSNIYCRALPPCSMPAEANR